MRGLINMALCQNKLTMVNRNGHLEGELRVKVLISLSILKTEFNAHLVYHTYGLVPNGIVER